MRNFASFSRIKVFARIAETGSPSPFGIPTWSNSLLRLTNCAAPIRMSADRQSGRV
jgi:hypothetical protein